MKKSAALLLGVSVTALAYAANAETANPSIVSFLATMNQSILVFIVVFIVKIGVQAFLRDCGPN